MKQNDSMTPRYTHTHMHLHIPHTVTDLRDERWGNRPLPDTFGTDKSVVQWPTSTVASGFLFSYELHYAFTYVSVLEIQSLIWFVRHRASENPLFQHRNHAIDCSVKLEQETQKQLSVRAWEWDMVHATGMALWGQDLQVCRHTSALFCMPLPPPSSHPNSYFVRCMAICKKWRSSLPSLKLTLQ